MKKYANLNVSFKIILRNKNKILILTETYARCLDLPGGRMEANEVGLPLEKLFKREIAEELGENVKYKILGPAFQYRRFNTVNRTYILTTVYEAKYLSGGIKLSFEHSE